MFVWKQLSTDQILSWKSVAQRFNVMFGWSNIDTTSTVWKVFVEIPFVLIERRVKRKVLLDAWKDYAIFIYWTWSSAIVSDYWSFWKLSHSRDWVNISHARKPNKTEIPKTSDIDIIMRTRIENVFILSYPQNSL